MDPAIARMANAIMSMDVGASIDSCAAKYINKPARSDTRQNDKAGVDFI